MACVTAPERWEPDWHMIDAVLASPHSSKPITKMRPGDRAWIVAALELSGEGAERSAERMGCSLRLIRSWRAEDITELARLLQRSEDIAASELRAEQSVHLVTRRQLAEAQSREARLKIQLDQLLDAHITGQKIRTCSKGHAMTPYNTYRHGRKNYCRECKRDRASQCRADKRSELQNGCLATTELHRPALASPA